VLQPPVVLTSVKLRIEMIVGPAAGRAQSVYFKAHHINPRELWSSLGSDQALEVREPDCGQSKIRHCYALR
jgi:hypothetical protein